MTRARDSRSRLRADERIISKSDFDHWHSMGRERAREIRRAVGKKFNVLITGSSSSFSCLPLSLSLSLSLSLCFFFSLPATSIVFFADEAYCIT